MMLPKASAEVLYTTGSFAASGLALGIGALGLRQRTALAYDVSTAWPPAHLDSSRTHDVPPSGTAVYLGLDPHTSTLFDQKIYPIEATLKSVWSPFFLNNLVFTGLKTSALHSAVFLNLYLQRVQAAEEAADAEGRELKEWPEFPWHEIQPRSTVAMWSWLRELATAFVRRQLEHLAAACLRPQLAWKLTKDPTASSRRKKARDLPFPTLVCRNFCTLYRSSTTVYAAEFFVSTALDAYRIAKGPQEDGQATGVIAQRQEQEQDVGPSGACSGQDSGQLWTVAVTRPAMQALGSAKAEHFIRHLAANAVRCSCLLVTVSGAAAVASAVSPGWMAMVAYNAADLGTSFLLTGPVLDEFIRDGPRAFESPRGTVTMCIFITSIAVGVAVFWRD